MSESPNRDLPGGRPSLRHRPQYLLEWPLRPWWRALLVLLALPALSIFLTYETVRIAVATQALDSLSVTTVQKALQYDPGNPALVHRLGVIYSYIPTELDPSEAVKYLRQATALNPRIWQYWTDPEDVMVRVYGKTAVVTGRATVRVKSGSGPKSFKLSFVDVYVKRGSHWQMVAWQSTEVAQPNTVPSPHGPWS